MGKRWNRISCVIVLAGLILTSWVWRAAAQETGEAMCEVLKKLPLPEGVSESGYSVEEDACVYRYQFGQAPEAVIQFFEKELPKAGWKIIHRSGGSAGIGEGHALKARKGSYLLSISAGQAFMFKVLEIRVTASTETPAEQEKAVGEDKHLEEISKTLPVPEGAGQMSKEIEPDRVEVTYQYGGDLKKAADWIEGELKEQGWKITRKDFTAMGGLQGGTPEATRDKYQLEVSFANAVIMKTISYTARNRE